MNETPDSENGHGNFSGRPVNPDGTANWRVIFDDPQRGILPVVGISPNPAHLRDTITKIAELLFRRRHDAKARADFIARYTYIIDTAADFETARADILAELRVEREARVAKAEQYVKNKRVSQAIERRREGVGKDGRKFPMLVVGGLAVLLLIAAGGLGMFLLGRDETAIEAAAPAAPKTAEPAAPKAEAPKAPEKASAEESKEPEPQKDYAVLKLSPITFTSTASGKAQKHIVFPLIDIGRNPFDEALCGLIPRVMEDVTFRIHDAVNRNEAIDAALLDRIARATRSQVNSQSSRTKLAGVIIREVRKLPKELATVRSSDCAPVYVYEQP